MNRNKIGKWGERLDAGAADEPTLELARQLGARRPKRARPSPAFVEKLRAELIEAPGSRHSRPTAWLLPVLMLAGLSIVVAVSLFPAEPASAADVFERANQHYAALAHREGVLHTQFTLSYNDIDHAFRTIVRQYSWQGELWEDLGNPDFRHQLVDDAGEFHYFAQRHGDQYWRSTYPVVASKVDLVYRLTESQYYAHDDGSTSRLAPIFGTLIDWLDLDGWWIDHGTGCETPFCAIGLQPGDFWDCDAERCVAHLSSAIGEIPAADLIVQLVDQEQRPDGRTVDVMQIRYSIGDELIRVLKFDTGTHELIEMVGYWMGVERARIVFGEREILDRDQASLFGTLPDQLREATWEIDELPRRPSLDSSSFPGPPRGAIQTIWMWPTLVQPAEGSTLEAGSELVLYLQVGGAVQEDLELTAVLCSDPPPPHPTPYDFFNCGELISVTKTVTRGRGTTRVVIPVTPDETWPDRAWLLLQWKYPDSQANSLWSRGYYWRVER